MYEVDHFSGDHSVGSWEPDHNVPTYAVDNHEEEYDEKYFWEKDEEYDEEYEEDYNRNISYTYNQVVHHPTVNTREDKYDEDYWKEREIEYSFLRRDEVPTQNFLHPFIQTPHATNYREGTSHKPILRSNHCKSIDTSRCASIDTEVSTEHDGLPAHCYPIFALEATTPSQHEEEHEENYKEAPATDQQGVLTRYGFTSTRTMLPESSDASPSSPIDICPSRGQHEEKLIDTSTCVSIDTSQTDMEKNGNLEKGNSKIGRVGDMEPYKINHGVEVISHTLEAIKITTPSSNPNGEASTYKLPHQLHTTKSIDGNSPKSIDTQLLPPDSYINKELGHDCLTSDKLENFRNTKGRRRADKKSMSDISKPYIREEMDEILTKAHIRQIDSLNDFKWRIDSVYHPLNDKIEGLAENMELLANHIRSIVQHTTTQKIPMPSTSIDDIWKASTDDDFRISIDRDHDRRPMTSTSIDRPTRLSITSPHAFQRPNNPSIDSVIDLPIDEEQPAMYQALKKEIKQILGSCNQWEEESLQKQLDIFYCRINSNMDWISKKGELMQKELELLCNKQKTLGSINSKEDN
ncbi:hypothetical protein Rs2_38663 [Raphanus sativus]|nr:hypothetical protein Rs2_38663 [Raphanus sativus]